MSDIAKDLRFNVVLPQLHADTFKQVLSALSKEAARHLDLSHDLLLQNLMDKEAFSCSGIGDGVATPNLKVKGLRKPFTILATLRRDVDVAANDEVPVGVVCLVLSPESEGPAHLRRLSRISRALKNAGLYKKIRNTKDADIIQSLFMDPDGWLLAA